MSEEKKKTLYMGGKLTYLTNYIIFTNYICICCNSCLWTISKPLKHLCGSVLKETCSAVALFLWLATDHGKFIKRALIWNGDKPFYQINVNIIMLNVMSAGNFLFLFNEHLKRYTSYKNGKYISGLSLEDFYHSI